jgi:hypothetical protein
MMPNGSAEHQEHDFSVATAELVGRYAQSMKPQSWLVEAKTKVTVWLCHLSFLWPDSDRMSIGNINALPQVNKTLLLVYTKPMSNSDTKLVLKSQS